MAGLARYFLCLCAGSLLASCQQDDLPTNLVGTWQAETLVVADSIWPVDVVPVSLELNADRQFTLHWYGGVTETGEFTWSTDWLMIHSPDGGRRKLRITHFDADSLALAGPLQDQRTEIGFRKSHRE
ncbi:MAG: hypothetical protein H6568_02850 [Lewinellaceae bacterium]|nr:hypothetical protein [Saprospiraceae bacterium]MCB9311679.1 hypothetical protein [Lewinellaceae bacterium]